MGAKGRTLGGLAVAVGAMVWLACVGDDPAAPPGPVADPKVPPGELRGACTTDGRCLAGLQCIQGVCLEPLGGREAGGPFQVDASSDGAPVVTFCNTGLTGPVGLAVCPFDDAGVCADKATECCLDGPDARCRKCLGARRVQCSDRQRCQGSDECCLRAAPSRVLQLKSPTRCPEEIPFQDFTSMECDNACRSNELEVCQSDDECRNGETCHAVVLKAPQDIRFGVCF